MTGIPAQDAPYALELTQVSKSCLGTPPVEALSDVSMSVARGEFLGIVGASDSGKSTLLHVIGTLTRPSSGSVLIDGLDTTAMSDRALSGVRSRNVGFVFQDYFRLPVFSATENGLLHSGTPASERTEPAKAMLERVGLSDRMHHLPKELSGGEQQRVAIARALVHDPSFVLADEPTGSVDSRNTASLLKLLLSLNDWGTTVILVTHDLEVAAMTGRQVALKDGRVEADSGAIVGRAHG